MDVFPKGLKVLCVDASASQASAALSCPSLAYDVTTVHTLEAAQASFASGAAAFDCVVCEHALLASAPAGAAQAFFRAADAVQAPVVLMGESPSQAAVLQGVHWGAAEFLETPLSMLKLKTLWQHKIRKMMEHGNGGVLPRRPSCPALPSASGLPGDCAATAASPVPSHHAMLPRATSLPGLSCPATPSLRTTSLAGPAYTHTTSSSLNSGEAGQPSSGCVLPAAAGDSSDATSGARAAAAPGALPLPGPPAPLACMRLGAPVEAVPSAVVSWPALPAGTTWGTPVGCSVPPPPLPGAAQAPAAPPAPAPAEAFPQPSIKWCAPGSLPLPATTYDLLLPEDWSLAKEAQQALPSAGAAGPLGLRLSITPDLLTSLNSALQPPAQPQAPLLLPAAL